jgi:hypothetical protein
LKQLAIVPSFIRSQHPETRRKAIDESLKVGVQVLNISISGSSLESLKVVCDLQSAQL